MSAILSASSTIDALLSDRLSQGAYAHQVAAPFDWDAPSEAVEVWAMDNGCRWWLLVDGERVRRLTLDEELVACRQVGLGPPVTIRHHYLTDPFDDVATTAEEHAQQSECPDGRGVVERHDPAWAQLPNDSGALSGGGRVFVPDWSTYVLRTG